MLVYKCAQVVSASNLINRPYSFKDDKGAQRDGISIFADVTVIGTAGAVGVVRFKGKTEEEVKAKVGKLTVGKACEIEIKGMEDSARGVMILNA